MVIVEEVAVVVVVVVAVFNSIKLYKYLTVVFK